MNQITVRCPAKINLDFTIMGKSETHPGYHEIETTVQTIDIYDYLTIRKRDKGRVLTGAMVAKDSLISRAVDALEEAVDRELPCDIHLDKQIPIGAGLGGGSSDAAGTLLGLSELFNFHFIRPELMVVGAKLGADVPLFINGGLQILTGIGTEIESLPSRTPDRADHFYIIFRPHKRLSTRKAYEDWDKEGWSFQNQALINAPQIRPIFDMFPGAKVSGKGPSCFIVRNDDTYQETMELIAPLIEIWDGDIFVARPCGGVEVLF